MVMGIIVQAIDTATTGTAITDTEHADTKYTADIMGIIAITAEIMAITAIVSVGVEDKPL